MAYHIKNRKVIILKEKFMRFMYGRYGVDSLGKFLVALAFLTIILGNITDRGLFSMVSWVVLIYAYSRIFSKNIYKRAAENQLFLSKTATIRTWFYKQKNMFAQRKTHRIYKCPTCKQKIRVPKGKGRIEIRCPKCNTKFIKTT